MKFPWSKKPEPKVDSPSIPIPPKSLLFSKHFFAEWDEDDKDWKIRSLYRTAKNEDCDWFYWVNGDNNAKSLMSRMDEVIDSELNKAPSQQEGEE